MKPVTEIYSALDKVDRIISGESLKNTMSTLEAHLEVIRQTAETAMIVNNFSDVALDIIKHYAELADELLTDVRCAHSTCTNTAYDGLCEPEAEEEELT